MTRYEEDELNIILENSMLNFQKKFDISEKALKNIFQKEEQKILSSYKECLGEAGKELKMRLLSSAPTDYYLDEEMWNVENCGHINYANINGHINYCNVHKYLHRDDQQGHQFISKTPEEVLYEKNREIKQKGAQEEQD